MGRTYGITQVLSAGAYPNFMFYRPGHIKLKFANAYNDNEINQITLEVIDAGIETSSLVTGGFSLFHRATQIAPGVAVLWQNKEGLEIYPDQSIRVLFELSNGIAPTVGTGLIFTIGYEVLI